LDELPLGPPFITQRWTNDGIGLKLEREMWGKWSVGQIHHFGGSWKDICFRQMTSTQHSFHFAFWPQQPHQWPMVILSFFHSSICSISIHPFNVPQEHNNELANILKYFKMK
jgi:hypothetical protein